MKLNNVWGYGQIFGYSAIDGPSRYYNDFVGTFTKKQIEIRFELVPYWVKITFPVKGRVKFNALTSDMIDACTFDGNVFITFADNDTLVGYCPFEPIIKGQKKLENIKTGGVNVYYNENDAIGIKTVKQDGMFKFCIHHSQSWLRARASVNYFFDITNVENLKKQRYEYYECMPKCKEKKYERLYYKALSVNKVNVRSAEGKIPCVWTTPDRVPHRHMWLWDSVFHALSMLTYNIDVAKNAIRAVISQIKLNGLAPCTMTPTDSDDCTQPQVLSWGVLEVYNKIKDVEFLRECVDALDAYLTWDMKNRDKNGNGLLEWATEPDNVLSKCGESGLDNSPRFDFDKDIDAIDFSTFLAHDADCLSKIYKVLDNTDKCKKWAKVADTLKETINKLLWSEKDGVYYDRLFDGKLNGVLTPVSFLPLFANIPSKEQAEKMVYKLTDEKLLWSKNPLSTISQQEPSYSNDMWRGGVWLNLNYFVIKGLKNYGYDEIADVLRTKTLDMVNKWYKKTGVIFEFYDPEDKIVPYRCDRKGKCPNNPDWRKKVHSICDFNWSASFTLLLIQNELY